MVFILQEHDSYVVQEGNDQPSRQVLINPLRPNGADRAPFLRLQDRDRQKKWEESSWYPGRRIESWKRDQLENSLRSRGRSGVPRRESNHLIADLLSRPQLFIHEQGSQV